MALVALVAGLGPDDACRMETPHSVLAELELKPVARRSAASWLGALGVVLQPEGGI
jgi:hypothetical protein